MTNQDRPNFLAALNAMAIAFTIELSPERIDVYWGDLKDLPLGAVVKACEHLRRSSVHFPRIAEIRNLIASRAEDDASEKWAQCTEMLRDCTNAKHPDPVVNAVIRQMGGWVHLGRDVKAESLHTWKAKEFRELYRDALDLAARHERAGIEDGGVAGMIVGRDGE